MNDNCMRVRPEVTGVNLTSRPNFDLPLTIVAFCDVRLDGLSTTLYGVALAVKGGKWIALPPKLPGTRPTDANAIQWNLSGPFPQLITDAMVERYAAFGGRIPDGWEPTIEAARARNAERREAGKAHVAAKIARQEEEADPYADYDVVEKGGVTWIGLPKPDDDSGVLRTLKVESEICDRAGL